MQPSRAEATWLWRRRRKMRRRRICAAQMAPTLIYGSGGVYKKSEPVSPNIKQQRHWPPRVKKIISPLYGAYRGVPG
jgi:hypothetical protein